MGLEVIKTPGGWSLSLGWEVLLDCYRSIGQDEVPADVDHLEDLLLTEKGAGQTALG